MNLDVVRLLRCIDCDADLRVEPTVESRGRVETGILHCVQCGRQWPIVGFVPRFVPAENYAANFGMQWIRFAKTQLDSHSGVPISEKRFFHSTGTSAEELRGKLVLDLGCGAGRFAEVSLSTGARVVAVDFSSAVDACWMNLGDNARLDVIQADVYSLPFKRGVFDYVYCLGVLQHTPSPRNAFLALSQQVKPGGRISVDVYPRLPFIFLWPKYWLRPLTRRMKPDRLLKVVERTVPWLLPLSDAIAKLPWIGRKLRYAVPVMNHRLSLPELSDKQVREWAILDTFDMFGARYDQPQTGPVLREWLQSAGLQDGEILSRGFLIARGRR